ncbi:MAG: ATP-binding cassette domain-containing protein [Flavonifractor plautii]
MLRDVNADFFRGRIHVIVGPSGSGKSTLFGALSGLYRYQGSARLEGMELSRHRRRLTGRMGFVTQSPQDQFVADTVLDEVTVSLRHSAGAGDPAAGAEEVLRRIQLWRFRRLSPICSARASSGGWGWPPCWPTTARCWCATSPPTPRIAAAPPPSWTPSSRRWWSGASPSSCPPTTGHWLRTTPTFSTS